MGSHITDFEVTYGEALAPPVRTYIRADGRTQRRMHRAWRHPSLTHAPLPRSTCVLLRPPQGFRRATHPDKERSANISAGAGGVGQAYLWYHRGANRGAPVVAVDVIYNDEPVSGVV